MKINLNNLEYDEDGFPKLPKRKKKKRIPKHKEPKELPSKR